MRMREKYYINTIEYGKNEFLYGVLSLVDDKPFDYMVGTQFGTKEEVLDNVTKMVLKKNDNKMKLPYRSFVFKYEDIQSSKEMNYRFRNETFYQKYSFDNRTELQANPSVFLSDLKNKEPLDLKIRNYKSMRDYVKRNYNLNTK